MSTCISGGPNAASDPDGGCDCGKAAPCCHDHDIGGVISSRIYNETGPPTSANNGSDGHAVGDHWTDTDTGITYLLTDLTGVGGVDAVWTELGTGGGGGGSHPDLSAHDALGLATDAELIAQITATRTFAFFMGGAA